MAKRVTAPPRTYRIDARIYVNGDMAGVDWASLTMVNRKEGLGGAVTRKGLKRAGQVLTEFLAAEFAPLNRRNAKRGAARG